MLAGITTDSGLGALLLCSAGAALAVAIGVIAQGWHANRQARRHPLTALRSIHLDGPR